MPILEFHSDFDRDGRLTTSFTEYQARQNHPGAIVLANLDVDRRTLPSRVNQSYSLPLDFEARTKERLDDEPLQLRIIVDRAQISTGRNYFLKLIGWSANKFRIYDQNR